jgi:putative addiction module component (TIGR02574 family)
MNKRSTDSGPMLQNMVNWAIAMATRVSCSMTSADVFASALALPHPDRAELARQLLLSLEPDDFDEDADVQWAAEIERRVAAIERGDYSASDWRDAMARIRQSSSSKPEP